MHDCLNDQPARTVCKVAQSEIYACLAETRARAARLIHPARRAPLNAGIKSFPTRDRRPSETCIPKKWARGPVAWGDEMARQRGDPLLVALGELRWPRVRG